MQRCKLQTHKKISYTIRAVYVLHTCCIRYYLQIRESLITIYIIRYKSLGKLEEHSLIHVVGGYLQIEYDNGSLCDQNRPDAPRTIRSTILFACDQDATVSTKKQNKK